MLIILSLPGHMQQVLDVAVVRVAESKTNKAQIILWKKICKKNSS